MLHFPCCLYVCKNVLLMRLFVLLFLALPFTGYTQDLHDYYKEKPVDSVQYYQQQLRNMQRQVIDSLRQSEAFQAAMQGLVRHQARTDNYTAFTLFTEAMHGNYSAFNNQIRHTGFSTLSGPQYRLGLGFTTKNNRTMIDILIMTVGMGKKSKKEKETLTSSVHNIFQTNLGYDLVKAKTINIYPYAGIFLRDATLSYEKPAIPVSNPATFLDYLQNGKQSTEASSMKVGYEAGIGMDVQISGGPNRNGGTMLFAKVSTSGPIGKEKYKINDNSFDPGIKYGQLAIAFGFKFFSRH